MLDAELADLYQVTTGNLNLAVRRNSHFTEHGVAMLSAVLRSQRAVEMSILIVRAFVTLPEMLASNKELAARMERLETVQKSHSSVINILAEAIE